MANSKKKHNKTHRMRRNAVAGAPARSIPRAVVTRRRGPTASDLAELDAIEAARKAKAAEDDTRGWRTIKALGGAAATTIAGAYLARQDVLPPKIMTGAISALGAALALGAPNKTVRSLGLGAMAAAGGQFGLMVIDDELIRHEDKKKEDRPQPASGARPGTPPSPGKKPSNASDIPADALARAYERARLRMALASDAPN
jgi:hypothetical protein